MIRSQRSAEEPVARLSHELPPARLGGETMTTLDILVDLLTEIFLDDRYFAVMLVRVLGGLDSLEVLDEYIERLIFGIGHEEREVDQVMGIGEVLQVREEHGQMGLGVAQRHAQQYALFSLPPSRGALDIRQVIVPHGLQLELLRRREQA